MSKSIFDQPWTGGEYGMSEQEYQWRMEKIRQMEEARYQERIEQVAKQRAPSGIESWHQQGFEARVLTEVRSVIDKMEKNHRNAMDELRSEVRHAKNKIEHINGFYTWLIETYPETVAQYKALMDLQKASEQPTRLTRDMP
jgi:hypothetical protein